MADNAAPVQTKLPDTGVKLPAAVMRAAARATELSEGLKNKGGMAITDVRSGETPVAPVTSVPVTPAPVTPALVTPVPETKNYTEHDYSSMKGRWERAQQENQQLLNRVNELQRIAAFVQTPAQAQPTPRPAVQNLISDKERTEYGDELIGVMKKAAKEAVDPELSALRIENEQLKRAVGGVQQNTLQDARQKIYQELNKEVPDWESYNDPGRENHEGFVNWLDQIDPLSGMQRKTLLENAYNTGQVSRVVASFKAHKAELAALRPVQTQGLQPGNGAARSDGNSGNANPDDSRSNAATTPAVDLSSLAAPGRARSGQAPSSPDKPIITRDEITEFYTDVTRGKYRGREADYHAIERQISEALKEGRVR